MTFSLAVPVRHFVGITAAIVAFFTVGACFAQNEPQNKTNPIPISSDPLPVKIECAFPRIANSAAHFCHLSAGRHQSDCRHFAISARS